MTQLSRLANALIRREDAEREVLEALKADFPVGATVRWIHGNHLQEGTVVKHFEQWRGASAEVENIHTGKRKTLSAGMIYRGSRL